MCKSDLENVPMGRTKYTPETRNAVMASFVTAMKGIIDELGVEGASIRRVSMATGYSSATLYLSLYFVSVASPSVMENTNSDRKRTVAHGSFSASMRSPIPQCS